MDDHSLPVLDMDDQSLPNHDMDDQIPTGLTRTKSQKRNALKKKHKIFHDQNRKSAKEEEKKKEEEEKKKEKEKEMTALLKHYHDQLMADMPDLPVYPHIVEDNPTIVDTLQDVEEKEKGPVSRQNIDNEFPDFVWLSEPGLHLGLTVEGKFCFASKIHAHKTEESADLMEKCLTKIMKISHAMPKITMNAAHAQSRLNKEGIETRVEGIMKIPAGHHSSQEKGKSVVGYAPTNTRAAAQILNKSITLNDPDFIEKFYTYRLALISPKVLNNFVVVGEKYTVPPFGQTNFNGSNAAFPFAGSLAVTSKNFSNLLHKDGDISDFVFGIWWNAKMDAQTKEYTPHFTADAAKKTTGGAFLFASYGYGVDFEECPNIVENIWKGNHDYHCTIQSHSVKGWTRFGTSIQTSRGLAMRTEALANMPPEERASKVINGDQRNAISPRRYSWHPLRMVNYKRLETLGDAILKFIDSEKVVAEHPHRHEGFLTKCEDYVVQNVPRTACYPKTAL
ncbi:hypothetical protein DFH11DRAFT_1727047 [Phellopilus nigrolimitatus]|nr:hypothetical protein DFH11DRAFT_1727047 [Phellopilus nigrolimitatus]